MTGQWKYQVRIDLDDAVAAIARKSQNDPALGSLVKILQRHDAVLRSQYDAFAGYVAEAEKVGTEKFHLYAWTKATIEDPAKEAKYKKSFTLYVGGEEVYDKEKADPLEAALLPLVGGGIVTRLAKHDTDPANNPQPPKRYRK